jgi:glucan phosphoethanolaminetransferase (alkaline phosphatase superfamily)
MNRRRSVSFARDAVVATVVVVGLYGLAFVEFQPIQVPGYLLIIGFDMFESVFGSAGSNYDVLFYVYLVGLGVLGGALSHVLRTWTDEDVPGWRLGVAGALVVTGLLALSFALLVLVGSSQLTPVLITGATGLCSIVIAGWLVGAFRKGAIVPDGRR